MDLKKSWEKIEHSRGFDYYLVQSQAKLMPRKVIYIGQEICWKLPEKDQKKWKSVERYKPDAIMEQMVGAPFVREIRLQP